MVINLATLYIILGFVSFIASAITIIILVKKFIDQPAAHGFFSYSDTMASGLLSLGLLLDGVIGLVPAISTRNCYHFKLLYGLFVVAIVTGFFSILGMAIERFQAFAVYRNHRHITRKFSIAWFLSSWTLSVVFVVILLPQIQEKHTIATQIHIRRTVIHPDSNTSSGDQVFQYFPASSIFPGPHTAGTPDNITQYVVMHPQHQGEVACKDNPEKKTDAELLYLMTNDTQLTNRRINDRKMEMRRRKEKSKGYYEPNKKRCPTKSIPEKTQETHKQEQGQAYNSCVVPETFIRYYFLLLFLLCFITPVLITISLNVFILLQ